MRQSRYTLASDHKVYLLLSAKQKNGSPHDRWAASADRGRRLHSALYGRRVGGVEQRDVDVDVCICFKRAVIVLRSLGR
jgi:hypothetical protein